MKNVTSIKTNAAKNESPKTPGGISKSLLTPCRRVGLSRNWKKKGPSPFISPLNTDTPNTVEVKIEEKQSRKRKSVIESGEKSNENVISDVEVGTVSTTCNTDVLKTPLRHVDLPRRKKSKTFLATLQSQENGIEVNTPVSISIDDCSKENVATEVLIENDISLIDPNPEEVGQDVKDVSSPPESKKAMGKVQKVQKNNKFKTPLKSVEVTSADGDLNTISVEGSVGVIKEIAKPVKKKSESKKTIKSPNELTKECIVVIQKKLLKVKDRYDKRDEVTTVQGKLKEISQPLFDSDSDEAPLSTLNKKDNIQHNKLTNVLDNDDDEFIGTNTTSKNKMKREESKKTTNTNKAAVISLEPQSKINCAKESKPPSQSSFDDDDDDFFDKKKTILIRKTYDKIVKPIKAKSTGSITQKDIDNLKARIEVKKKMLLARSMTEETEELRSLIKKWQKGCQEALMELMELMKIKCPDKHNMDYSEILQMLKIPPSLVGYDSDHDCFNTPDDASIVLSKFNDF